MKTSEHYHKKEDSPKGPCEYRVWDKDAKCLVPCGKTGQVWEDGWGSSGNPRATLCDEHGEFVSDAVRGKKIRRRAHV